MTEAMQNPPMLEPVLAPGAFELSVPRNAQGERVGIGAIAEPLRPGLPGETLRGGILKALFHAGRSMQAPRGVAEQPVNRSGLGYVTERERAQLAARAQEVQTPAAVQRQPDTEITQLAQTDRQQAEKALDATRSALKSEVAAQEVTPHPQDSNKEATQTFERKAQEPEPETTNAYLRRNGQIAATLTLPKNYTRADLTRAIQALGGKFAEYEAVYDWKTLQGWRTVFGDIWKATKKAWQASAPPTPTQK